MWQCDAMWLRSVMDYDRKRSGAFSYLFWQLEPGPDDIKRVRDGCGSSASNEADAKHFRRICL